MSISSGTSRLISCTMRHDSRSSCFASGDGVPGGRTLIPTFCPMPRCGSTARRYKSSWTQETCPTNACWTGTRSTQGMKLMFSGSPLPRRGWRVLGSGQASLQIRPCSPPTTSACRSGLMLRVLEYLLDKVLGTPSIFQQPGAADYIPVASQTKMKQLNPHPTAVLPPKTLLSLAACQEWLRPTLDSRCCRRSVFILSNLSSWTLTKRKFSHASSKQPSPLVNVGRRHATKQHTLCFSVGCQSSTSTIQPPISNSFPTQQCPGIAYGMASTASRLQTHRKRRRMLSLFFAIRHACFFPLKKTRRRKPNGGSISSWAVNRPFPTHATLVIRYQR